MFAGWAQIRISTVYGVSTDGGWGVDCHKQPSVSIDFVHLSRFVIIFTPISQTNRHLWDKPLQPQLIKRRWAVGYIALRFKRKQGYLTVNSIVNALKWYAIFARTNSEMRFLLISVRIRIPLILGVWSATMEIHCLQWALWAARAAPNSTHSYRSSLLIVSWRYCNRSWSGM